MTAAAEILPRSLCLSQERDPNLTGLRGPHTGLSYKSQRGLTLRACTRKRDYVTAAATGPTELTRDTRCTCRYSQR